MSSHPALGWEVLALALSLEGTEKNMTFGEYPHVGPKDARELHFGAKKLLASGINPMTERKAEAEAKQQEVKALQREADSSFEKVARKWWEWWSIGKSPRHAETLMNRLEADVFPVIGHLSIDAVQTGHIRDIMLTVETRGASDVAKRAHQSIGQIFRFAIARELASRNPAADFKPRDVLAAAESENFARVDEKDLPELLAKMDDYNGDALTRFGLKLLAYCFPRHQRTDRSAMDRVRLRQSAMGNSAGAHEDEDPSHRPIVTPSRGSASSA